MTNAIRKMICIAVLTSMMLATAGAQTPAKPLTNADIIEMSKKGMPVAAITIVITSSQTNFDISYPAMVELQKAGVDPVIGNLMLQVTVNKTVMAQLDGRTTIDMPMSPGGTVISGPIGSTGQTGSTVPRTPQGQKQDIDLTQTLSLNDEQFKAQQDQAMEIIAEQSCFGQGGPRIKLEPDGKLMPCQGASGNMAPGSTASIAGPTTKMTSGFMIGGEHAITVVPPTAIFSFVHGQLPISNTNEWEPLLVKLTPIQGARIVARTIMRVTAKFPVLKWETQIEDSVVAARSGEHGTMGYLMIPTQPLPPGEYALVLRRHGLQNMLISDYRNDPAMGIVQAVWDFRVEP